MCSTADIWIKAKQLMYTRIATCSYMYSFGYKIISNAALQTAEAQPLHCTLRHSCLHYLILTLPSRLRNYVKFYTQSSRYICVPMYVYAKQKKLDSVYSYIHIAECFV